MTSQSYFDIIVIGGGPSGASAAISMRNLGLSVCLVEAQIFPRFRPGETLAPGALSLLEHLGIKRELITSAGVPHIGIHMAYERQHEFHYFNRTDETWYGLHIERQTLDTLLLQRAVEVGCNVLQPAKALKALIDETNKPTIITTKGLVAARFVVDATGANRWLARQQGQSSLFLSTPLRVDYEYRSNDNYFDGNGYLNADKEGWSWNAPIGRGMDVEYTMAFGKTIARPRVGHPKIIRKGSSNVTWRIEQHLVGHRYLVVGDAACSLDPASGHGILRALLSGINAAYAINSFLHSSGEKDLGHYGKWLFNWFIDDCFRLSQIYERWTGYRDPIKFQHMLNTFLSNETV